MVETNDILEQEIETRLEDLRYEIGDDEISEVKIYQKLRDEFKEEKYRETLINLGIIDEDLGIEKRELTEENENLYNDDNKDAATLVKILLDTSQHIKNIDKRIRGFELQDDGTWKKKVLILLPVLERIKIISFLETIYLPQNIMSKKNLTIKDFESRMNKQLQDIRVRLENKPDSIIVPGTIKYINGILLNEVSVVINSIETGRVGDLTSDMVIGSYNERQEPKPEINRDEIMKALSKG